MSSKQSLMTQDQTITLSKNQYWRWRKAVQIMGHNSVPQHHPEVLSTPGELFSIYSEINCEKSSSSGGRFCFPQTCLDFEASRKCSLPRHSSWQDGVREPSVAVGCSIYSYRVADQAVECQNVLHLSINHTGTLSISTTTWQYRNVCSSLYSYWG